MAIAAPVTLFVASSQNAYANGGPASVLRSLLVDDFGDTADVRPWTRSFELSAAYIELLEQAAASADFAVFVATPDDIVTSGKRKLAPHDNVVFELGLFMGVLGRQRCFVVQPDEPDLQRPTNLLGVDPATVMNPMDGGFERALRYAATRIDRRVRDDGPRHKVDAATLETFHAARSFMERVGPAWWERVLRDHRADASALSFFTIDVDATACVTLTGKSYMSDGKPAALWTSQIARVDVERRKILYAFTGRAAQPHQAHMSFNGFGQLEFDQPANGAAPISRGAGAFWNVDESHPETTIIKPTEIRRIVNDAVATTMKSGTRNGIRALVIETLATW